MRTNISSQDDLSRTMGEEITAKYAKDAKGVLRHRRPSCPLFPSVQFSAISVPRSAFRVGGADGSALIVALWVIALLSLLVGSFAFDAQVEARITSYSRKRLKAEYLARSGIEVARMLMDKGVEVSKTKEESDPDDRWHADARRLAEGLAIRGLVEEAGAGSIILDIVPEPARRDVNRLKEEDWERILEVGEIPEELWPDLIDSFYDWTDTDDDARLDGAETEDYYATLDKPYRAKNGPLDTVEELLLVKGFDTTILSGGELELGFEDEEPTRISGIKDLLTVYGDGDGKVNVNAASQRVLMTLVDVDELYAGAIIEEREGWLDDTGQKEDSSFESVEDLYRRIPDLNPGLKSTLTTDSKVYRITSVGTVHGVSRRVWCVVRHAGSALSIVRWTEEE
jgi:general secretion pathway protein K